MPPLNASKCVLNKFSGEVHAVSIIQRLPARNFKNFQLAQDLAACERLAAQRQRHSGGTSAAVGKYFSPPAPTGPRLG